MEIFLCRCIVILSVGSGGFVSGRVGAVKYIQICAPPGRASKVHRNVGMNKIIIDYWKIGRRRELICTCTYQERCIHNKTSLMKILSIYLREIL